MCARFTLFTPGSVIAERFNLAAVPDLVPRYNIAPSQLVAVIGTKAGGGRGLAMFRWGFVPGWANEPGPRPVNAKAETVAEKPSFRDAFRQRRCLIPADGFYEWRLTTGGLKQPVFISPSGSSPQPVFAFAGLWEVWRSAPDAPPLRTCTIVTTSANARLSSLHDRMPVVLSPSAWSTWLDPTVDDRHGELSALLVAAPDDVVELRDVSRAVNDVRNNGPELLDAPG